MSQSAWPALICQLYDYYFDQTAAYFGAKSACEPLHIFWDQWSNLIRAVNDTRLAVGSLRAEAWIYDLQGREKSHKAAAINILANSAQDCFPLSGLGFSEDASFVRLQLHREAELLSENFYWTPAKDGSCKSLNDLPAMDVSASATVAAEEAMHTVIATLSNPTSSVALAIRLSLIRKRSGQRILPAMYEDNYFTLLPGGGKTVKIQLPNRALARDVPELAVSGWNIRERIHSCDTTV
jgi:Exo-beta-D-glucosaminidase Ig-fold domain